MRYIIRRLRRRLPEAKILLGCWLADVDAAMLRDAAKADLVATTLSDAVKLYLNAARESAAAAKDLIVERIFVNAAIKKALCREAGNDRSWLHKVRPYYGHDYHFHVRIKCPADSPHCQPQDPVPAGEVCGKDLDHWFTEAILYPKPSPIPSKPKPPLTMAELPPACRQVLLAP